MKFCTNCGARVAEGSRFCTECGFRFPEQPAAPVVNEQPMMQAPVQEAPVQPVMQAPVQETPVQPVMQAPVQEAPVQPVMQAPVQEAPVQPVMQAPVQEAPVQPVSEAPAQKEAPKKQKKGKSRLLLIAVIVIALLVGVFAMGGGGGEDPNAGIYNCLGYSAMGITLDGGDDYIELKSNGKATLVLMGEELPCEWTLEGTDFVVNAGGMEFYGVLENGVIDLNISDMIFTYERDPATAPAVSEEASEQGGGLFCSHEWVEANCQSPKTCSICGKTKGKTVDHVFSEASHQNPPTCYTCGLENGEKLPAEMEVHGITEFMELGQTYEYTTLTKKSHGKYTTVGTLEVVSYDIVESTDKYPAKEGYEWRIVTMKAVFSDKKARGYGVSPSYCHEDYYNIKLHDDTSRSDDEYGYHTVLYDNKEYEIFYDFTDKWSAWVNHKTTYTCTFASCVPIGYDGVVVGPINEGVEYPEGGYIYDVYNTTDFCLFRCY